MSKYTRRGVQVLLGLLAVLTESHIATAQTAGSSFKFDFGGKAATGYTKVSPDAVYSAETGFGFDFGSKPSSMERGGDDALHDGLATSDKPFFFSVKVPEGNYKVTVTLGDSQGESKTTIRAESARMMLPNVATTSGKFETRTFIANMHTSHLPPPPQNAPGGSEIRMVLRGESEALHWDDRLTIEFNGAHPCLCAMEIEKIDDVPTVFVAGDSTVADPRSGPGGNWPTHMCQYFKPEIAIANNAQSGETLKSFITGLRLDKVLSQMKRGDYFMIQFGHNDQKTSWPQTYAEPGTTFNAYLKAFIAETRRCGATPILVTPMERRGSVNPNGDTLAAWSQSMRDVAKQENVALIDLSAMSKEVYKGLGDNLPSAFNDVTHPSGYGGYLLSKCVVMGIRKNVPELAKYIVDDFQDMDLAHPDPMPEYLKQTSGRR